MARRGRKPKTLKEKKAEIRQKLDKVLLVSSMFHNIKRNKDSRRIAKHNVRKLNKELKACHKRDEKKTIRFLIKECQDTADKMESFIADDTKLIGRELKTIKVNGIK